MTTFTRFDSLLLCALLAVAIIWGASEARRALAEVSDHSAHAITASTSAVYQPR